MILFHGSQNETVEPCFGKGEDHHDFGKGFYMTDSAELAKEWSVCRPESHDGWVHAFDLDLKGLNVFDFREVDPLSWVAELMRHRDADDSAAYHRRAPAFIRKYGVAIDACDVLIGWRADASYFYIVKAFVRGEIDVSCLPQLLKLGGFGLQYVVKTPSAYARLRSLTESRQRAQFDLHHAAYDRRDADARNKMRELIADPNFNRLERLFFDLVREERT